MSLEYIKRLEEENKQLQQALIERDKEISILNSNGEDDDLSDLSTEELFR